MNARTYGRMRTYTYMHMPKQREREHTRAPTQREREREGERAKYGALFRHQKQSKKFVTQNTP